MHCESYDEGGSTIVPKRNPIGLPKGVESAPAFLPARPRSKRHRGEVPWFGAAPEFAVESEPGMFEQVARPDLTDQMIRDWLHATEEEARQSNDIVLTKDVIREAERIISKLRNCLPLDTDIYPIAGGSVAVEVFGREGFAYLLVCEPGGSALCIVTVNGVSRRARYESSGRLPDGFLREGIEEVRPATEPLFLA